MKKIKAIAVFGFVAVLLILATRAYLGYHYFYKYKNVRARAKSIEGSFLGLEENLKKSVWFSKNPVFYKEMARLYLEMALAENDFGTAEKRDFYLDQALESLAHLIKRNPIDAVAYYEMGKVYLLYNFPLLTYIEKGKLYFLKALEFDPANEFLNLNILYIFLAQWDFLNDEEKSFVYLRLGTILKNNESFIPRLQKRWKENFGNVEKLKEILSSKDKI